MRRVLRRAGFALGMGLVALVWAGPFLWMLLGSFKPREVIIATELVLRFTPTWEHYDAIFSRHAFWTYTRNSFVVAVSTTVITVTASTLAAYALSRYRAGGHAFEFWLILTRMLPPATLLVPLFLIFRTLGLINTLTGLILADASFLLSFCIWLLRGFFDEVPLDLEEAAACDGATRLQGLVYVVLPLAAPGVAATVILSLIFAWNEYLFAIVFASATASKTLPAAANDFITGYAINWGPVFASGVVIVLPVALAALGLQRFIVRGLTLGAFH
ncbi:MAG: carbohydrate ABC transporter permease [Candidatus Rokubacteria bacterium]|nr:carbohydrate ABC transporter permease [Candidatus Rokubacteria bacterium]